MSRLLGALNQKLVRRPGYFREQFRRHKYFREQVQLEWHIHVHTLNGRSRLCILPRWYCRRIVCIEEATAGTFGTACSGPWDYLVDPQGKPLSMCIELSYSGRMPCPAKRNDVSFTVLFLPGEKVHTKGVTRAGRLRVCLGRHLRKPCRILTVKFSYSKLHNNKVLWLFHRGPVLQHEKSSVTFQKNAILF